MGCGKVLCCNAAVLQSHPVLAAMPAATLAKHLGQLAICTACRAATARLCCMRQALCKGRTQSAPFQTESWQEKTESSLPEDTNSLY